MRIWRALGALGWAMMVVDVVHAWFVAQPISLVCTLSFAVAGVIISAGLGLKAYFGSEIFE